jgi:tetratricopeptide (TPR) repeat protein
MLQDRNGIGVTTATGAALAPLDRTIEALLSHRANTGLCLKEFIAADPGCPLGHLIDGFIQKILAQSERDELAVAALDRGIEALQERGGTTRECELAAALTSWCEGDMLAASALLARSVERRPTDPLTVKLAHSLQFMTGQPVLMYEMLAAAVPAWDESMPYFGYVLGCAAFAAEERGEYAEAEKIGRRAVQLAPNDVWGAHAVAHAFEMRSQPLAGLAWLASQTAQLEGCGNFSFHVAWHRALFHLALGQVDAALALYDSSIRAKRSDDFRDISNGASLLWRIENAGASVGDRWRELANLAVARIEDDALDFARMHYLMAIIGDRRWQAAEAMLQHMALDAARRCTTQDDVLAAVGLDLAAAMLDIARGAPDRAVDRLFPVRNELIRLGGSNAQRDVFVQMLMGATFVSGKLAEAATLLEERSRLRVADLPPECRPKVANLH